jgi:hypothetical protein
MIGEQRVSARLRVMWLLVVFARFASSLEAPRCRPSVPKLRQRGVRTG